MTREEAIAIVSVANMAPKEDLEAAYKFLEENPSKENMYTIFRKDDENGD